MKNYILGEKILDIIGLYDHPIDKIELKISVDEQAHVIIDRILTDEEIDQLMNIES